MIVLGFEEDPLFKDFIDNLTPFFRENAGIFGANIPPFFGRNKDITIIYPLIKEK